MDGVRLSDRLAYGAGCTARRVGFLHDAYRPNAPAAPMELAKRFLRLPVAFVLPGGSVSAPNGFGVPFRQAWADWSYLQTGDYLQGPEGIFFIAEIELPKPMLVVRTNTTVSMIRPAAPVFAGLNQYNAILPGTENILISDFPANLVRGGVSDRTHVGLPDDTKIPGFTALIPRVNGVQPRVADILLNNAEQRYVVNGIEQIFGIWRISLNQAVT